jgi:hypothetical protein
MSCYHRAHRRRRHSEKNVFFFFFFFAFFFFFFLNTTNNQQLTTLARTHTDDVRYRCAAHVRRRRVCEFVCVDLRRCAEREPGRPSGPEELQAVCKSEREDTSTSSSDSSSDAKRIARAVEAALKEAALAEKFQPQPHAAGDRHQDVPHASLDDEQGQHVRVVRLRRLQGARALRPRRARARLW